MRIVACIARCMSAQRLSAGMNLQINDLASLPRGLFTETRTRVDSPSE